MRFSKPSRVIVHGNVRWCIRRPKAFGGGREYCETETEAEQRVKAWRKEINSSHREFVKLHPQDQAMVLGLLAQFDGDVVKLKAAAEIGLSKVASKKLVPDALKEFHADHKAGTERKKAVGFYLSHFEPQFKDETVSTIEALDIQRWLDSRGWGGKTFNDCRQVLGQFWKYCIRRRWASVNPIPEIPVQKVPRHLIAIYTPEELGTMLNRLAKRRPLFVPAIALCAFAGLRISEMARVTWEQVNEALGTGWLELTAAQVGKTSTARAVPILPNLRAWLEKYRQPSGLVLPETWKNKKAKLGELGSFISRLSGVAWKENALRHSYGTFRFKIINDVGQVTDEMGTSLHKFEKHYRSKSKRVTIETARDFFTISPSA